MWPQIIFKLVYDSAKATLPKNDRKKFESSSAKKLEISKMVSVRSSKQLSVETFFFFANDATSKTEGFLSD
jgi:hypothetical protein